MEEQVFRLISEVMRNKQTHTRRRERTTSEPHTHTLQQEKLIMFPERPFGY